jgi:hypothetical protein
MRDILLFVAGILFGMVMDWFRLWREHSKLRAALKRSINKEQNKPQGAVIMKAEQPAVATPQGFVKKPVTGDVVKTWTRPEDKVFDEFFQGVPTEHETKLP